MVVINLENIIRKLFCKAAWIANESLCALKDQKLPICLAYIGFSKAFNKVPQYQMLFKVRNIEIDGSLFVGITDFMVRRQQMLGMNLNLPTLETSLSRVPLSAV